MPNLETIINKNLEVRKLKATLKSQLNENQINYPEFEILFFINEQKETSPSLLAEQLYCERATISRCLRTLHDKSLINYTNDDNDRRKVYVAVTKEGKSVLKSVSKTLK